MACGETNLGGDTLACSDTDLGSDTGDLVPPPASASEPALGPLPDQGLVVRPMRHLLKLEFMRRLMSRASHRALLSVSGIIGQRMLPAWNVTVSMDLSLHGLVTKWAAAILNLPDVDIPPEACVSARRRGASLSLDKTVAEVRPQLPIWAGRLGLIVSWPSQDDGSKPTGRAVPSASSRKPANGLNSLRISTRYAEVDRNVMGYNKSSTFAGKVAAGFYGLVGDKGVHLPCGYGDNLRPSPKCDLCGGDGLHWRGPIVTRELVVFSGEPGSHELFRARLVGPRASVENWAATARKFHREKDLGHLAEGPGPNLRNVPFPVFIPSVGRAKSAHLNWEAPHAFGPLDRSKEPGTWPVVIVVVEPHEEERYKTVWPGALLLVLPRRRLGPGYARWVVQMVCSKAYEWKSAGNRSRCGSPRRFPWSWICDDNLLCFFRLVGEAKQSSKEARGTVVHKRREWGEGIPMFWEAMVAVQQHPNLVRFAIAGFLRDDGTATCKKKDWRLDVLSLYKVVLLNNRLLKRLGVEYLPGLQKFEDIYLNNSVQRRGGQSLKCQCYCFRAMQLAKGGCEEQRRSRKRCSASIGGLMDIKTFESMSRDKQDAVKELLDWVRLRERQCQIKRRKLQEDSAPLTKLLAGGQAGEGCAASSASKEGNSTGRLSMSAQGPAAGSLSDSDISV